MRRKISHSMSNDRFLVWFEKFKAPYKQQKFIHSYKCLENSYSELVIKNLLTFNQRRKVNHFIKNLPKMSDRRFRQLLKQLKNDSTVLYKYSPKDFTHSQHLIIRFYLLRNYIKTQFFKDSY